MKIRPISAEKCKENEKYTEEYYKNNAEKLRRIVDRILKPFGWITDKYHYYSLANEVFVTEILQNYDGKRSFDAFVTTCLSNKIRSEITHINRDKRMPYLRDKNGKKVINEDGSYIRVPILSLDSPVMEENGDETTYKDILESQKTVESEIFDQENTDDRIEIYLNRLSKRQRMIVELLSQQYTSKEIQDKLHITKSEYKDCLAGIKSHENIKILYRR